MSGHFGSIRKGFPSIKKNILTNGKVTTEVGWFKGIEEDILKENRTRTRESYITLKESSVYLRKPELHES